MYIMLHFLLAHAPVVLQLLDIPHTRLEVIALRTEQSERVVDVSILPKDPIAVYDPSIMKYATKLIKSVNDKPLKIDLNQNDYGQEYVIQATKAVLLGEFGPRLRCAFNFRNSILRFDKATYVFIIMHFYYLV